MFILNCRYILPVIFLSIFLNIPKFLEPTFEWQEISSNLTLNETFQYDNVTMPEKEYEIGKLKLRSLLYTYSFLKGKITSEQNNRSSIICFSTYTIFYLSSWIRSVTPARRSQLYPLLHELDSFYNNCTDSNYR